MSAILITETQDNFTVQIVFKKVTSVLEMEAFIKEGLDSARALATKKAMEHIHKNIGLNLDLNFLNTVKVLDSDKKI